MIAKRTERRFEERCGHKKQGRVLNDAAVTQQACDEFRGNKNVGVI
jgi:hypothetical protein